MMQFVIVLPQAKEEREILPPPVPAVLLIKVQFSILIFSYPDQTPPPYS
jgi:hypothetical protein